VRFKLLRALVSLIIVRRAVQTLWEALEQKQARGGLARVAQSSIDLGDIKARVDAITSLLEVFHVCWIRILCVAFKLTCYSSKQVALLINDWVSSSRYVPDACIPCSKVKQSLIASRGGQKGTFDERANEGTGPFVR